MNKKAHTHTKFKYLRHIITYIHTFYIARMDVVYYELLD